MTAVIIPVHNGELYLREAISSVLAQTHRDFALIVVDDGSTDSSAEIVKEYMRQDHRLRLIRQCHRGVSAARNTGLKAAAGHDLVAFLDHDDVMLPFRLERQLAFAEANPEAAAFGSTVTYINEVGRQIGRGDVIPISTRAEMVDHVASGHLIGLHQPSVMAKREALLDVGGYDVHMTAGEDLDLWMKLAESGYLVLQQHEVLTLYRLHPQSTTVQMGCHSHRIGQWVHARAEARTCGQITPTWAEFNAARKNRPIWRRIEERRRHMGWACYRAAGTTLLNGRALTGMAWLGAAFALRPWYIISRLWWQLERRMIKGYAL